MKLEYYQIPESYQSYLEKFETNPKEAIERLQVRVEKRNAGAIGYFFLAWLHYQNSDKENAIEAAWQAKVRAPGSKFMERLHYFLSHPKSFDAWVPEKKQAEFKRSIYSAEQAHPISDLDSLITKLSSVERKRIHPSEMEDDKRDLSEKSADVDDIVTETLAVIHEKQSNYSAAIQTYERLKEANPSKEEYYSKQIKRLSDLLGNKDSDDDIIL
ncbi:MAG: hypothetical protein EA391_09030 [Balneolaceae bacterium]|nr:MAG: hypothetical protein EA391_09030 [Balneolaceae bacterium]